MENKTVSYNQVREDLFAWGVDPVTIERFIQEYSTNPGVWRAFQKFTLSAIEAKKKIGAKAVMERVRWEAEVENGAEFKVNNNWISYYGRVFALKFPQYSDFFEFREVRGLKAA